MRWWAWLLVVAAAIVAPSVVLGPGPSHSGNYNFVWTSQFGDAIRSGIFYPRWLPHSFEGLGSPTFFFYPPIAYWISGGFNALGLPVLQAINAAAFLMLFLSGVTMHWWLKERSAYPLLGAICYMVAPYHLLDFGVRGALAEFASFIWLPLIAMGIEWLPRRKGVLLLGLSFAALILTHLPMATLAGVFLIAPLVLWRARTERVILIPAIGAGLLAMGLAAFYLLPAMTLQRYIWADALWRPYFNPAQWNFFWRPDPTLGNLQLLGLGLIALAIPARSRWTTITACTSIAAIGVVPFLWLLPPLDKVQFPWRLLGVTEFAAVTALFTSRFKVRPIFLAVGLAMLAVPYVLLVQQVARQLKEKPDYSLLATHMPEPLEYLPGGYFDSSLVNRESHVLNLEAFKTLPRGRIVKVDRPGIVTLGRWAFPIWGVERDGKAVPSTGPLIHFRAEPGTYRVVRIWLWPEIVGAALSAAALLVALSLLWRRRDAVQMTSPVNALGA
ncbi:MAG: integral membrane-like protein [Sphingobium sp.]|uniref:integral membrane-like protein n=1 Tax=Sphingobium sp. TaxID=1912891 RepID=UPI0029BD3D49|nr:integral membrane-like protein [Sphingobium sp.]MDX3909670.1 integral membrane-like protein [Sphingobium sp.]